MDEDAKLLKIFELIHGKMSGSCYLELHGGQYDYENEDEERSVCVMKDGNICWKATKTDLLFDFITKDWEEEIDHQAIDDINNPEYNRDDI